MKVKLTKLSETPNPDFPAADQDKYVCGSGDNGPVSLFVGYTAVGTLGQEPKVGNILFMLREERNGVKCGGILQSSEITKIENNLIHTKNSVYLLEEIGG